MMRWSVFVIALIALILAFNNQSIFELVGLASSFGLVSLFLPFTFTLFVKNTNSEGVILGMLGGLFSWALAELVQTDIPAIFYGLLVSLFGLISGIVVFKKVELK